MKSNIELEPAQISGEGLTSYGLQPGVLMFIASTIAPAFTLQSKPVPNNEPEI